MRIIVLGFDGATFGLIRPGVERGELPGFVRLLREGAWGVLRSTIPCDSPSAWTTFATGVNPGRHGVFGFMARRADSYEYEIGSSHHCRVPTLWERASRCGACVGVVNVPFTYPPHPVNGFLVAGMMAPDVRSSFTYPPGLRDELLRAVPGYSIGHGLGRGGGGEPRATLVRDFASTIAAREQAMRWLAAKYSPDLLVCVFTVLDRMQHFLWADMDARHPDHDSSCSADRREAIRAAYRLLDGVVARTLGKAGDDALVAVLSDHGFEGVARCFYVNAWLAERGLLALTGRRPRPGGLAHRAARLARRALALVPGGEGLRERLRARRLISQAFVNAIDWPRTKAWFGLDRGLWINVRGRDPEGIIKPGDELERLKAQLTTELESLRDPDTGHRIVGAVHRREALYQGQASAAAPDLILEPARQPDDPRGRFVLSERLEAGGAGRFTASSAPISGYHNPDGVVLLWGKGVAPGGQLADASIADVAPTILAAMNLPGGDEMDGKPLPGFARQAAAAAPHFSDKPPAPPALRVGKDEQHLMEQQLKDLGYLD